MKYFSHLNTAVEILDLYDGKLPFHHFIKEYLKLDRKYGSKDRKSISRLCYSALRVGMAFPKWSVENKIRAGLFLCSPAKDSVTEQILGDYNEVIHDDIKAKWKVLCSSYEREHNAGMDPTQLLRSLFPVPLTELSSSLNTDEFLYSFFQQPDLFLRIRPGYENEVTRKLDANNLVYERLPPAAVKLPISTKLDEIFEADKEIVIQDYSSQLTGRLLADLTEPPKMVWDACAASGGKSLLISDLFKNIRLTVTDIRTSIIFNLENRFRQAGIKNYHSFITDLAGEAALPFGQQQDLVIADVPCSGSGTWSRTPEQLMFFRAADIDHYQQLQQRILRNIIPMIRTEGHLLFITCSVFKKENEENITFVTRTLGMELVKQELIIGYPFKADTLFAALFKKP